MDKVSAEIIKTLNNATVLKTYPESGQKSVFLLSTSDYPKVILKIIKEMNERVKREIDIVNDNDIMGVPKIFSLDSLTVDGTEYHYLLEEYISGNNLKEVLLKEGTLAVNTVLCLLDYLLQIVVQLEELGIVHRDIKPENIIVDDERNFHLIDFGIARNLNLSSLTMTSAGRGPHTPGYGAPELFQYNKPIINSKADLFSVGVVAYECLFGEHPFITGKESNLVEVWYKTATVTPKNYSIEGDQDGQLIGFIQTLMQKQPSRRPPSATKALEWFHVAAKTIIKE